MLQSKVNLLHFVRPDGNYFVQQGFSEASYSAVTTLVFVAPSSVLPRIANQLNEDINTKVLNDIPDLYLGVWATPEGTTFVDGSLFYLGDRHHCF
jgi:hypothetical protein